MSRILTKEEIINAIENYNSKEHYGKICGNKVIDEIMRMDKKMLAVVTAKPNQGKSTFLNYYTYMMNKSHGWKTLYFQFETSTSRFLNELNTLYGNSEQVAENCIIVNVNELTSLQDIFSIIDEQKRLNNIDIVVIDPFMRLNSWLSDVNTYNIGKVLTDFQNNAIKNDILTIIVAHPTKVKEGESIDANSILGSTFFYSVADFIISVSITDRENMITEIKALKIRYNLDMGVVGKTCTMQFDPLTKTYKEYDQIDEPFGREKIARQIIEKFIEKENSNTINNTIVEQSQNKAADSVKNDDAINCTQKVEIKPQEALKEPFDVDNIKVSLFKTCNTKVAQKKVILKESTQIGKEYKNTIDEIRKICLEKKDGWEQKKRELKLTLPCFTTAINGRTRRVQEDTQYNNILCFDIDEKDNADKTINEIREIVKSDKHTLYCSLSTSGKGLYGYFIGNGNINDYVAQYDAMIGYFRNKGINIDTSCRDITRVRFVSYDDNEYWNTNAEPFTDKTETYKSTNNTHHQNNISNLCANKRRNKLFDEEKEYFLNAMDYIKQNHLNLTENHEESKAVGAEIAYYFDVDGVEYYQTIRKQREGYDQYISLQKYYNICKWVSNSEYERNGRMQMFRHLYYRALSEHQDKQNNLCTCGTFKYIKQK